MSFWMREASLQIGSKKYSMDNLYFEFEVPFEDSDTIQTAKFKAYNLSESTRKGIKRGDVIILNAGYEGDVGAIFVGQVSACSHKHQNTEWITEISATAAMDQWLNSKVSKTYAKGSTAKEIVSDLLNIFGVEIGDFSLATNKVYDRGLVCNGKVKDELKRIVVNDCKSRFLIRNGSVFINDPTKGIANGLVLTPQSGLLLSGNEVEETVIAVGSDSQKSSATKSEEGNYVTRECLLNYHIGPAEQVVIQSQSLNGRFIVAKGKHTGTPKGNWKTTIEMKPSKRRDLTMPRQNRKQAYEDAKKQADAAGLCVADVVKVLAFDEAALTVDVQPITRYPDEDTFQTKPPVLAVPVATIYGGGFVIRPVYKAGDIGVVVYLDRDSDAVIAGGAEADPNTERLHSGDDAVFVGGIRTGGSSISGHPAGSLSLGTADGGVYLSISPSGIDIKGNVTITGDLTVTGGVVNLN